MKKLNILLSLSLVLLINHSLSASNLENRYSSINVEYAISTGDVEGTGYQSDITYQFAGGENSGPAFLLSYSSLSIDEVDGIDLSYSGISLDGDQILYGIGYIFKNENWHVIPYYAISDLKYSASGLISGSQSIDASTFGVMLRTAISPSVALSFNVSYIDIDDLSTTVTVDGLDYTVDLSGGGEAVASFDLEHSINDSLSIIYGAGFSDGVTTFSGGVSFSF